MNIFKEFEMLKTKVKQLECGHKKWTHYCLSYFLVSYYKKCEICQKIQEISKKEYYEDLLKIKTQKLDEIKNDIKKIKQELK